MNVICSRAHLCGKKDCPHYEPHVSTRASLEFCSKPLLCEYVNEETTCIPVSDLRGQHVIVMQKEKEK